MVSEVDWRGLAKPPCVVTYGISPHMIVNIALQPSNILQEVLSFAQHVVQVFDRAMRRTLGQGCNAELDNAGHCDS